MTAKGMKLTQLAEMTGVPYRSLQNYFSRRTEMPASVYLKLCSSLGMDAQYVRRERFELDTFALGKAVLQALGDLTPTYVFSADGSMGPVRYEGDKRSDLILRRDAETLAVVLAGAYDQAMEMQLRSQFDGGDD